MEVNMATQYGKEMRKIRIDKSLVLGDMAKDLKCSVSYLSAIENGKREIPPELTRQLVSTYDLTENQQTALEKAAIEVQKSVQIDLDPVVSDPAYADTALMVARSFPKMRPDQIKRIRDLFLAMKREGN
jgi:transcriptional regulator with XRE-family HTH domain